MFTKLQVFFRKTVQVLVNVCNRFVIYTVFEPLIKRKSRRKRNILCFTAYNSKTFRIFAVLIKKTRCKTALQKIMMLQYRIKRYQAMGNGAMCQTLNGKLQKLLSQQVAM